MKQFNELQIAEIISTWNANRDADAQKVRDNKSLRDRYLAPLASKGYTAEQIENFIAKETTSGTPRKIYDILTVSYMKRAGVFPNGNEEQETEQEREQEREEQERETEQAEQETEQAGGMLETMLASLIDARIKKIAPLLETGAGAREITVKTANGSHEIKGTRHEQFETVLNMVVNDRLTNKAPWLVGPAGTGKNVLARQIAEALGLEFYYTNCVTDEYKLIGYMDANGNYHETPFYIAFKYGGLFMLDEIDGSCEDALIDLNGALSDYEFTFPNNEKVKAHENFHAIAAGNTYGRGADLEYNGRAKQDESARNRFVFPYIGYSKQIEESLTSDRALLEYARAFRKACKHASLPAIMSYRDINAIATLTQFMPVKDVLHDTVYAGLSADDIHAIEYELPSDNVYTTATKELGATL